MRVSPHPVIQAWRGVERSTPVLGRHTGLTVSDIVKYNREGQSACNKPRRSADRHHILKTLTSERQWRVQLQEGNVIVKSLRIETFVAYNFLNCVGSGGAHLGQADVASTHCPQSAIG